MSETRDQKRVRLVQIAQTVWPGKVIGLFMRDDFGDDDELAAACIVTDPEGEWAQVLVVDVPDSGLALDAVEAALAVLTRGRT